MIELKYRDINNGLFQQGLQKLAGSTAFTPREAYNVAKIADKVGQETRRARELYSKILKKYAKMNEKGAPVLTGTAPFFEFSETADKEAFAKEYEDFLDITFEISRHKLTMEALPETLGTTPAEMIALEPLWAHDAEKTDKVVPMRKGAE